MSEEYITSVNNCSLIEQEKAPNSTPMLNEARPINRLIGVSVMSYETSTSTRVQKIEDYQQAEIRRFQAEIARIEKAPLFDRREGKKELIFALNVNHKCITERISWLLAGHYGAGAYYSFKRMSKRHNRRAWLLINMAALEFNSPTRFTVEAWNGLTSIQQDNLNRAIDEHIREFDREQE